MIVGGKDSKLSIFRKGKISGSIGNLLGDWLICCLLSDDNKKIIVGSTLSMKVFNINPLK